MLFRKLFENLKKHPLSINRFLKAFFAFLKLFIHLIKTELEIDFKLIETIKF
jgi:hypothetical protein